MFFCVFLCFFVFFCVFLCFFVLVNTFLAISHLREFVEVLPRTSTITHVRTHSGSCWASSLDESKLIRIFHKKILRIHRWIGMYGTKTDRNFVEILGMVSGKLASLDSS